MSALIAETESFDPVHAPENGDAGDASDLEALALKPLANRTRYLWDLLSNGILEVGINVFSFVSRGSATIQGALLAQAGATVQGSLSAQGSVVLSSVRADPILQRGTRTCEYGDLDHETWEKFSMVGPASRNAGSAKNLIVTDLSGANRSLTLGSVTPGNSGHAAVRTVKHGGASNILTILDGVGATVATLNPGECCRVIGIGGGSWERIGS